MHPLHWWSVIVLAVAMPAGIPGGAQGGTPLHPEIEPQAMSVLEHVTKVPAEAQRFSVTVDIGYDVVQDSGQKIEFGETRTIVVRHPDHIRIETVDRDGSRRGDSSSMARNWRSSTWMTRCMPHWPRRPPSMRLSIMS